MIFNELRFIVNEKVFYEIFKNPDNGFGFKVGLRISELNQVQFETFKYLSVCQEKRIMGSVQMVFKTEAIGEIKEMRRTVEKIELKNDSFYISNTY